MSDSTTLLDAVTIAAGSDVRLNELFDAHSPASAYGRRAATTTGLTWGYYGARYGGTLVPNGTAALTANQTNYLVAHRTTGAVSVSTATTNWNDTGAYMRLYKIVAGASSVTNYEDHRFGPGGIFGAAAEQTLTYTRGASWSGAGGAVALPTDDIAVRCRAAGTIVRATVIGQGGPGSVVIDVRKCAFGAYPTTSSIAASAKPTINSAHANTDATLTGWTKAIAAGDILLFRLDSNATFTAVSIEIEIEID